MTVDKVTSNVLGGLSGDGLIGLLMYFMNVNVFPLNEETQEEGRKMNAYSVAPFFHCIALLLLLLLSRRSQFPFRSHFFTLFEPEEVEANKL